MFKYKLHYFKTNFNQKLISNTYKDSSKINFKLNQF